MANTSIIKLTLSLATAVREDAPQVQENGGRKQKETLVGSKNDSVYEHVLKRKGVSSLVLKQTYKIVFVFLFFVKQYRQ